MNRKLKIEGLTVAVDFDGTCVTHAYPKIGRFIGAERVLKRLVDEGAKLILWTMRDGRELQEAVDWFSKRGIPLYGIQRNPSQDWTTSPKAEAQLYIDDVALGCPLCEGFPDERPFVDWHVVEQMLWPEDKSIQFFQVKKSDTMKLTSLLPSSASPHAPTVRTASRPGSLFLRRE